MQGEVGRTLCFQAHGGAQLLAGLAGAQALVVHRELGRCDEAITVRIRRHELCLQESIQIARLHVILWSRDAPHDAAERSGSAAGCYQSSRQGSYALESPITTEPGLEGRTALGAAEF